MDPAHSLLFQPFPLGKGGKQLPNRIWLPAMVTWRSNDAGEVTDDIIAIYRRYVQGGAGMVVLEAMGVRDVASGPLMRIGHDRSLPGLRRLVEDLRRHGRSLLVPQIIDFLKIATRKATREYLDMMVRRGHLPPELLSLDDQSFEQNAASYLDPRQLRDFRYGYRQTVGDLSLSEIQALPGYFAAAARRARDAGFDGVELHFAHAYTLASFLSVTNPRRDAYGGDFEGRMRLPLEVVRAVREEVGSEFIVGCRMLGSEDILLEDGRLAGNRIEDAREIAVGLARAGLDFLSISRGGKFDDATQPKVGETAYPYTGNSGHRCIPRSKQDPFAVNVPLAAGIRAAVRAAGLATPVVAAGKIVHQAQAESILQEEQADLVGMARALLADPDLPHKWRLGAAASQRVCVFCPWCEQEDQHHRVVSCTLWPKVPGAPRARKIPELWSGEGSTE